MARRSIAVDGFLTVGARGMRLPEYAGSVTLYMQWGYFATGANPLGILASEGLRVVVAQ